MYVIKTVLLSVACSLFEILDVLLMLVTPRRWSAKTDVRSPFAGLAFRCDVKTLEIYLKESRFPMGDKK